MKTISNFIAIIIFIGLLSACEGPGGGGPTNPDPVDGEMYFPPEAHNTWSSTDPSDLSWDLTELENLNSYLEEKKTKGFIILKDGKIVVEEYFNGHTVNANWNWYSAAKSLTSVLVGIAQDENFIDINEKSSSYLGNNWSLLTDEQQDLVKVKNHISMTTGLKNPIGDFVQWTCTIPLCMQYEADAGSQWAYHQGAFTLTQDIITKSTGTNFKQYCKDKVQNKIGMNGNWNPLLDVNIFSSTTRSMARFGLLALNEGVWDEEIIYPLSYHEEMIQSSQNHNKAYGYLWWLNGKQDFLGTQDGTVIEGSLIPNAPDDMYAALGAQDQKIYIVPSENMVIVRTGDSAGNTEFANSSFDNELWSKINLVLP